jgi:pilus assembly protein CpaB
MNKKTLVPLLGIAFVVAIVATGIFYGLFSARLQSKPNAVVLVAARDLDRGAVLAAGDVKLEERPSAPEGSIGAVERGVGQTLLEPVRKGDPVLASAVSGEGTGGGLGIPTGSRAVSIHLGENQGVAGMLRPGHRVDIQLLSLPGQAAELKTILQDVAVLRVDAPGEARSGPVVTLLLPPLEADEVTLADTAARLRLVLRNPLDRGIAPLPRQTLPPLFQKDSAAKAAVKK